MQNEIYKLSVFELTNLYKDKALSPVEASKSVLERIKKIVDQRNKIDLQYFQAQAEDAKQNIWEKILSYTSTPQK